jgi:hypothetical protein
MKRTIIAGTALALVALAAPAQADDGDTQPGPGTLPPYLVPLHCLTNEDVDNAHAYIDSLWEGLVYKDTYIDLLVKTNQTSAAEIAQLYKDKKEAAQAAEIQRLQDSAKLFHVRRQVDRLRGIIKQLRAQLAAK